MTEKSNALYRIMQYHHVVQLFKNNKLYFSHPSKWDDPFETRVKHAWEHMLYAQCWCKKSMSDAMWRIYSQNHTSLRIRTTREKLSAAMGTLTSQKKGFKKRLRDVSYYTTATLQEKTLDLTKKMRGAGDSSDAITSAADILCLKRNAFDHENEVRAILYCPSEKGDKSKSGIEINIEPHLFVESVLIDPRAPDELAETFIHYFKDVLGFTGTIAKSALYRAPKVLEIERDDEEL